MKALATELRLYIAELLMGLIIDIAPSGKEGAEIRETIFNYFKNQLKK